MTVTCPHCGKTFVAPDIEQGATVEFAPVTCPNCKQTVDLRANRAGLLKVLLKRTKKDVGL